MATARAHRPHPGERSGIPVCEDPGEARQIAGAVIL
jgi:hypothetical protein